MSFYLMATKLMALSSCKALTSEDLSFITIYRTKTENGKNMNQLSESDQENLQAMFNRYFEE